MRTLLVYKIKKFTIVQQYSCVYNLQQRVLFTNQINYTLYYCNCSVWLKIYWFYSRLFY